MAAIILSFEVGPLDAPIPAGIYVLTNYSFKVSGAVEGPKTVVSAEVNTKKELEVALESKITESLSSKIAGSVNLDKVAEAIKTGNKKKFAEAFGLEAALKIKVTETLDIETGVQLDACPFFIAFIGGKLNEKYVIRKREVDCKFEVEGKFHFGLTPAGWAYVAKKVGPQAIKQFIQKIGPRLAPLLAKIGEAIVAGGAATTAVVIVGSVAGTVVILAITAAMVNKAHTEGTLRGLATWYQSAYVARVFGRPRPSGILTESEYVKDINKVKDQMILEGEQDALLDAKATAQKNGANISKMTNKEIMESYWEVWIKKCSSDKEAQTITDAYKYEIHVMSQMREALKKRIKDKYNIRLP